MEAIIVIVGFLGVGKTTLLKKVSKRYIEDEWNPTVILNDYGNAAIDAEDFFSFLEKKQVKPVSGSCICCSGTVELRNLINRIPERDRGITLIEANGTTDAVRLMGFLSVKMKERFLPPVQVAVVDVRHWQKRGEHNELEANQVQAASVVVLNFVDQVSKERIEEVEQSVRSFNSKTIITLWDEFDMSSLPELAPSENQAQEMEHRKAHWSSCSVELPERISSDHLKRITSMIPSNILRVKGWVRVDDDESFSHFERIPSGEVSIKPYPYTPSMGPTILIIGPGSDPEKLQAIIEESR